MLDKPGGIFVRRLEQISHDDRVLLQAVARIVLDDEERHAGRTARTAQRAGAADSRLRADPLGDGRCSPSRFRTRDLIFQNGLGGFTRDGHEYVITLQPGQMTPAPWVNVIANPYFGTVDFGKRRRLHLGWKTPTNSGSRPGTTIRCRTRRGEAFYIRDEQTGQFWSPTPSPARGATPYVIRHGFGYTVFEHTENGIASELWVYVAMDAPVKFTVLKLRNISGRARRLSRHGLLGMGAGRFAAQKPAARPNRSGPQDRRVASRAITTTPNSRIASRSSM